jgi:orotate phosphoribosyltransferase
MYDRNRLKELIKDKALKFGDFTLASGKKSTFYLDCKQVTLNGEAAWLIGEGILDTICEKVGGGTMSGYPIIAGMSIGADPMIAATITVSAKRDIFLRGCMVRKQPKGHGTNQYLEGPIREGDRAVVIEDVVTTGGSSLEAIQRLEDAGITVLGVIAIIDRQEGGAEAFTEKGYPFSSLFTIKDFIPSTSTSKP